MRLRRYIPLAIFVALADLVLVRSFGDVAPLLLLLFVYHAALPGPSAWAPAAWWIAGILRDFTVGGRLGTSALLFVLTSVLMLAVRQSFRRDHALPTVVTITVVAFIIRFAEPLIAWGPVSIGDWSVHLRSATAAAALTGALSLPWALTLGRLPLARADDLHSLAPTN